MILQHVSDVFKNGLVSEHVSKDWYLLNKIFYLTFDPKPPRPLAEYDALLSIGFSFAVSYLAGPGLSF